MRYFVLGAGYLCVALGVLGIFLPILPTTPFLLLASYLFYRSSHKAQQWLLGHKYLGSYIADFQIHKSIPLRVKIYSISMLWITILLSAFVVLDNWWLRIMLLAIATAVTIHILSFKTKKD
ncbi:MAG: YbaN family protein [Prevotellaceae bacterium]|nr:YbaN family protein [Prevotellaceae bacterium]